VKIVDHLYNTLRIDIANYRVRLCNIFFEFVRYVDNNSVVCPLICKNKRVHLGRRESCVDNLQSSSPLLLQTGHAW